MDVVRCLTFVYAAGVLFKMSDFIECLISAVKRSRILWDMSHKHYHNRLFVDREWIRIAADLGETKETVKCKWKNLRDNFRRELKKIPKSRSGDDSEQAPVYQGSWVHFNAMLFLKSVFTPRDTQGNIEFSENTYSQDTQLDYKEASQSQNDSQNNQVIQSEEEQQSQTFHGSQLQKELQELENELPDKDGPITPIQIRKKRNVAQNPNTSFEREMLDLEKKKVELLYKDDNDGEDMNFFKSLLPHVKLLPSINKLAFRSAVQNLLINEIVKVQNQTEFLQQDQQLGVSCVSSPYPSPAESASDISHHSNPQVHNTTFINI